MEKRLRIFSLLVISLYCLHLVSAEEEQQDLETRNKRFNSVFSIIRFPNTACAGSGNKNGTCYTKEECDNKGGTNSGSCAEGYGICCTFSGGCGSSFAENCTYFESSTNSEGACRFEVCKCNSNICQLRLDFNMFAISGPSTDTATTSMKHLSGAVLNTGGAITVKHMTQCLTDTFTVTSPGNQNPPVICGTNTGEHMYVDAADACNNLDFQFSNNAVGTTAANRQFSIKITQYACDYENLAPDGCTQYFFGSSTGSVQTFNFQGGSHLANQDQKICVRAEKGNCRICWDTAVDTDFHVSGTKDGKSGFNLGKSGCCSYNSKGTGKNGYDCLIIPGAIKGTAKHTNSKVGSQICGGKLITENKKTVPKTVCSERVPFDIRFVSDSFEAGATEGTGTQKGFKLRYFQEGNC